MDCSSDVCSSALPFGGRGLSGTGLKAGGPLYLHRLVRGSTGGAPRHHAFEELPGPVGERNLYGLHPRGRVLLMPATRQGLSAQLAAVEPTGNAPLLLDTPDRKSVVYGKSVSVRVALGGRRIIKTT